MYLSDFSGHSVGYSVFNSVCVGSPHRQTSTGNLARGAVRQGNKDDPGTINSKENIQFLYYQKLKI